MAVATFATLSERFAARYPNAHGGRVDSISAAAGTVPAIEAGAVRGFAALSGNLVWVKLLDHRLVRGEVSAAGDIVQIEETEAKRLVYAGGAVIVTEDEARAAAEAAAKAKGKS